MRLRHLIRHGLVLMLLLCGVRAAIAAAPPERSADVNEERDLGNAIAETTGAVVASLLVAGVIISLLRRRRRPPAGEVDRVG
jgi:hypothetical protein